MQSASHDEGTGAVKLVLVTDLRSENLNHHRRQPGRAPRFRHIRAMRTARPPPAALTADHVT
jgi:hypothetical protein